MGQRAESVPKTGGWAASSEWTLGVPVVHRTVYSHPVFAPGRLPAAPTLPTINGKRLPSLGDLLHMPFEERRKLQLGFVNLLCASSLPGSGDLDIHACMGRLHEWTDRVRTETERQLPRFRARPKDFRDSEAYFRVLVMITVLQRDLGVSYDPAAIASKTFASSREGFIHGVLTGDQRGTCANLPVLYADVGRRLGYPIYLVCAKGHIFCRWNSARTGERFNIEGTNKGLNVYPDAHYEAWPRPILPAEIDHGIYLRDLDPMEEVGVFMQTRGHVLRDAGYHHDAIVAYAHAHRLAPADPHAMAFLMAELNREIDLHNDRKLPDTYYRAEIINLPDGVRLGRYAIDDRYAGRATGAMLIDTKTGEILEQY